MNTEFVSFLGRLVSRNNSYLHKLPRYYRQHPEYDRLRHQYIHNLCDIRPTSLVG
jgi:hypothetical protein